MDELLFVKDTYAVNFKLSASPKNILAEMLEMSLIDFFPNIWIALRISLTLPVSVAEVERTFSLQKRVKIYLRSTTKQARLNEIATRSINCDMARKLDFSTIIIHDFARKKSRRLNWINPLATNNNATIFQFLNAQGPPKYSMAWAPECSPSLKWYVHQRRRRRTVP